jgi:hypothetical protein
MYAWLDKLQRNLCARTVPAKRHLGLLFPASLLMLATGSASSASPFLPVEGKLSNAMRTPRSLTSLVKTWRRLRSHREAAYP